MLTSRAILRYAMLNGLEVRDTWDGYAIPTPLRMAAYDYAYELSYAPGTYMIASYPESAEFLVLEGLPAGDGAAAFDAVRAIDASAVTYAASSFGAIVAEDPTAAQAQSFLHASHVPPSTNPVVIKRGYVIRSAGFRQTNDSYQVRLVLPPFKNLSALPGTNGA